MMIDAIDSVFLAVTDLAAACRPYEQLGLKLSPAQNGQRTLAVGGATNLFAVRFVADAAAGTPLAQALGLALAGGQALFAVALSVVDLDAILGHLEARNVAATRFRAGGEEAAWLALHERAGTDLVLVQHASPGRERHDEAVRAGRLAHSLPLKRLDHLAVLTHDLDEKTRFWAEVLGIPVAGEVMTPTLVIRQLRLGDAVLELLGPASPDSPMWQRPPGLVSMASWEVADLEGAVRLARAAGFTVTQPGPGPLPGTQIATVQGSELAGVNMQLLQYI